jgi:DNA-3-methyladenine glycosylase I
MIAYHDKEWGVPVHDDRTLFEFLTLEGAQAGLSWQTILNKRQGYRQAFAEFDPARVARFSQDDEDRLRLNPAIVRNRLKIASTVSNAQAFLEVQQEFGSFDSYLWSFVDGKPIQNSWRNWRDIPAQTKEAETLSKDLK